MLTQGLTFRGKQNNGQGDSVVKVLKRHEQWLAQLQRELRSKVNKTDFVAGLSSKVSLSDITSISMDLSQHEESLKMNQSNSLMLHSLEDQLTQHSKSLNDKMKSFELQMQNKLSSACEEISTKQEKLILSNQQFQNRLLTLEELKGDRSELDKIMHLSSLLAIQFQLIKKRFTTFETDYNMVWKEISNIYTHQETMRNVIDTDQKSRQAITSRENNLHKKLFGLSQNRCVTNLFCSEIKPETNRQQNRQIDWEEALLKMQKSIKQLKQSDQDHSYSLKLYGQRLGVVQNYHETWFKSLKEIQKTKKQLYNQKDDLQEVFKAHREFKKDCEEFVSEQVNLQVRVQSHQIKQQIQEACQQITSKMVLIVGSCAKNEDFYKLEDVINNVQLLLNEKITNVSSIVKKHNEHHTKKAQVHEQMLRSLQRQLKSKMKINDFNEYRKELITSQQTISMLKKTQNGLKKQINNFVQEQNDLNKVLCAQNVVCRWIWSQGALKGGNLVVWDKQVINTLPQNFQFLKNEYCLKVSSGGVYKIELGFYAKKKPTIQIIVNGQTVISAVNSNSYVLHHSSGKLKDISNTQISGLTFYDFLTLPQNSRIAISYTGDLGHGFIGMHRL